MISIAVHSYLTFAWLNTLRYIETPKTMFEDFSPVLGNDEFVLCD